MKNNKYIKSLFLRVLVSIILFLSISIFINHSDKNLLLFKKNIYDKTLNFSKINKAYNKYFGDVLPETDLNIVSKDNLVYKDAKAYKEGVLLTGVNNISLFKSGIVVFIGEKEHYGNTIIVQGMDGIDYWYGNVSDINVKLYDYIESDTIIANVKDGNLYVVFKKNGEVLNFEEFI